MEETKSTELGRKQGTKGVTNLVLPSVLVVGVIVKKHVSLLLSQICLFLLVQWKEGRNQPAFFVAKQHAT